MLQWFRRFSLKHRPALHPIFVSKMFAVDEAHTTTSSTRSSR